MTIAMATISDPDGSANTTGTFEVTFDNSYTANGHVLICHDFNRRSVTHAIPVQKGPANRLLTYDPGTATTGKLRIWTALGTEATGASDQSTISCRIRVTGPRS